MYIRAVLNLGILKNGILEGNWGDFEFTNDTSPEIWTSTVDILNRWQETGKPTQYGQCWVFGALQCSMMRTVGVGARQVTAFGAVIDMSLLHDKKHKSHHVIDTFYDIQGNQIYMDGQAWNFHSWTTIWMNYVNKTLNNTYGGWHDLDGTPPGTIGPAPVQGTLALDEDFGYNVSQIVSTVHSTFRTFLTECDSKHKKGTKLDKKHCKVHKLMKYDHTGLKLIMTSASFKNGTLTDGNVTTTYVNAKDDAFIPYKDESEFIPFAKDYVDGDVSQRRILRSSKDKKKPAKKVGKMIEGAIKIITKDENKVSSGQSVEGSVEIDTAKFKQDEMVQVNLLFTLQNYRGGEIKTIESIQERVLIKGDIVSLPFVLDSASYLEKDMNDVFIKLVVTGTTKEKDNFFETTVIDVDAPEIEMEQFEIPEEADFFEVKANFTNPYGFHLENVCMTIHSHELNFKGKDETTTQIEKCTTLKAKETITFSTMIQNPSLIEEQYQNEVYYVLAQINSADYLPSAQSNVEIRKTEETKEVEEEKSQQQQQIPFQVIDLIDQELF